MPGSERTKREARNIIIIIFILLIISCGRNEHLLFNDIPIDGNLDKFAEELIKSGFSESQVINEAQIELRGKFLNEDCEVVVFGTGKGRTTYKAVVNLQERVNDSLNVSFGKIQKLYTSKYGTGSSRYQQFQNSERFLFNEPKFARNLKPGDFTRYKLKSGYVTIEVCKGYISIIYLDKLNYINRKREVEAGNEKESNEELYAGKPLGH